MSIAYWRERGFFDNELCDVHLELTDDELQLVRDGHVVVVGEFAVYLRQGAGLELTADDLVIRHFPDIKFIFQKLGT